MSYFLPLSSCVRFFRTFRFFSIRRLEETCSLGPIQARNLHFRPESGPFQVVFATRDMIQKTTTNTAELRRSEKVRNEIRGFSGPALASCPVLPWFWGPAPGSQPCLGYVFCPALHAPPVFKKVCIACSRGQKRNLSLGGGSAWKFTIEI